MNNFAIIGQVSYLTKKHYHTKHTGEERQMCRFQITFPTGFNNKLTTIPCVCFNETIVEYIRDNDMVELTEYVPTSCVAQDEFGGRRKLLNLVVKELKFVQNQVANEVKFILPDEEEFEGERTKPMETPSPIEESVSKPSKMELLRQQIEIMNSQKPVDEEFEVVLNNDNEKQDW